MEYSKLLEQLLLATEETNKRLDRLIEIQTETLGQLQQINFDIGTTDLTFLDERLDSISSTLGEMNRNLGGTATFNDW